MIKKRKTNIITKIINFLNSRAWIVFTLLFLFLFFLELNNVGLSLRERITILSTLDFSWFLDAIERFSHGYILGRDFTFTYGPLFQVIYSLPTLLLGVPSYISVALSPLVSFVLIFAMIMYVSGRFSEKLWERVGFVLLSFFVVGLLISNHTDTVRMLFPVVYSLFLFDALSKKRILTLVIAAVLPTFFGLYTYNSFITSLLIVFAQCAYRIYKNRSVWKECLIFIFAILIMHFAFSFLFTGNLDYIFYSMDAVKNYRYIMDVVWTHDRSNVLLIFPVLLLILNYFVGKSGNILRRLKESIVLISLASFIQLYYALSRSDSGHLLFAIYPSIFSLYTIIFFLGKKFNSLIILGLVVYVFIPFKPNFYNTISPTGLIKIVETLKTKPAFFQVYKLPNDYYFNQEEIENILKIVKENEGRVYIYPYDAYILNIQNSVYNSFALGIYTYSDSPVEAKTVDNFKKNPPKLVILGIDKKGALALDDIPNFTRNPQVAAWLINNYKVIKKTSKYLILSYSPGSGKTTCGYQKLVINLPQKDNFFQKLENNIKPALYYMGGFRLPYSSFSKRYLIFQNLNSSADLEKLFNGEQTPVRIKGNLTITRVSPILGIKDEKVFNSDEYRISCQ